eukprot:705692-Prymnesium_polylepis.1
MVASAPPAVVTAVCHTHAPCGVTRTRPRRRLGPSCQALPASHTNYDALRVRSRRRLLCCWQGLTPQATKARMWALEQEHTDRIALTETLEAIENEASRAGLRTDELQFRQQRAPRAAAPCHAMPCDAHATPSACQAYAQHTPTAHAPSACAEPSTLLGTRRTRAHACGCCLRGGSPRGSISSTAYLCAMGVRDATAPGRSSSHRTPRRRCV